jgi:hypothetical protein
LVCVVQCKRLVPSLSHRGILSSQDCAAFITPVPKVQRCSCQNVTRLTVLTVNPNWQKFFFRKREKAKAFSFFIKRNLYRFSCTIQYLSSVVKANNSHLSRLVTRITKQTCHVVSIFLVYLKGFDEFSELPVNTVASSH